MSTVAQKATCGVRLIGNAASAFMKYGSKATGGHKRAKDKHL